MVIVKIHGIFVSEKSPVDGELIVSRIICAEKQENMTRTMISEPVYMEIGERDQLMKMNQM